MYAKYLFSTIHCTRNNYTEMTGSQSLRPISSAEETSKKINDDKDSVINPMTKACIEWTWMRPARWERSERGSGRISSLSRDFEGERGITCVNIRVWVVCVGGRDMVKSLPTIPILLCHFFKYFEYNSTYLVLKKIIPERLYLSFSQFSS